MIAIMPTDEKNRFLAECLKLQFQEPPKKSLQELKDELTTSITTDIRCTTNCRFYEEVRPSSDGKERVVMVRYSDHSEEVSAFEVNFEGEISKKETSFGQIRFYRLNDDKTAFGLHKA